MLEIQDTGHFITAPPPPTHTHTPTQVSLLFRHFRDVSQQQRVVEVEGDVCAGTVAGHIRVAVHDQDSRRPHATSDDTV